MVEGKAVQFISWSGKRKAFARLLGVLLEVSDGLTNSGNGLSLLIRDGDVEFLFKLHDQLDGINESAPRSLVKEASLVTSASSTPSLSTMIFFTLDAMSDMIFWFGLQGAKIYFLIKYHPS